MARQAPPLDGGLPRKSDYKIKIPLIYYKTKRIATPITIHYMTTDIPESRSLNFIEQIIEDDLRTGKNGGRIATRFPPEPNGYLHIGHAKSICLNFGLAKKYGGDFTLRFDDTNPSKEETEYVESIIEDVQWITGEDLTGRIRYASDYFDQMYAWAEELIQKGKAYVCDQTPDEMRDNRGTPDKPMIPSAGREFSPEKNLELFRKMRNGEFAEGERTLRAKIDLASPNFNMRDPVMYRIVNAEHHRTGTKWIIYPMYDWAHGLEDSIENITHSICTLEFEHHRLLYDWFLDNLDNIWRPHQYEFARLNLTYTVMSKRKLLELVKGKFVTSWSDPRMPAICGLRRRGYTPEAIRAFCREIGVAKMNSIIDVVKLENAIREDLNKRALRCMGVLRPLKLVIDNYPEGKTEQLEAINNPENEADGTRLVPFSRVLYIERDDFMENAPKKYFRLTPGQEVRLRYAYYVTCTGCVKDVAGNITEVHCNYDPETRGGTSSDGRKVQGTIHWVSAEHAVNAEIRLYDRLFTKATPDDPQDPTDYKEYLNKNSLEIISDAQLEPALTNAIPKERYQFERIGYFCIDSVDSKPDRLVFNRTVSLRDSWAKIEKKDNPKT
ncbi:MAG: glutamine--tRNA ligase/YqeY domain fusion protein [Planctomycetaceae bacterium]|jgi:glutaminyl-tRNA synthetase|nr:glutamine--tRNA ligase/YqeY domain fusion protein [Planctomycetaceae bacterium]